MKTGDARAAVVPTGGAIGALRPLSSSCVIVRAGFWAQCIARNCERTISHGYRQLVRAGNLENFRAAAAGEGVYRGGSTATLPFFDSDVYKWLEAVAWELGREWDAARASDADRVIELVAAAQRPDGYLNTYVQLTSFADPFDDLQWGHELYCTGHLVQAAIAWRRSLNDDRLLAVAERAVDRATSEFGTGGRDGVCGHPEFEMALVELYRLTGNRSRLDLARRLIDLRGHGLLGAGRHGSGYWQDHLPVRLAPNVVGHAVRQLYLDCGAVDVAVETGDIELLSAVIRRWDDMVASRSYVTGAVGVHHLDESFGEAFELPPDRAYGETCAAIASVMLAWRLLLATGESRYADVAERTLFNAVLPALSDDGTHFFYVNPLHRRRRGEAFAIGAATESRQPWLECACCPPNLMRTISSIEQQFATLDEAGLQIHQYATASISFAADFGAAALEVSTEYPWDGHVQLTVAESPQEPWRLSLRLPLWCRSATVSIDGILERHAGGGRTLELERSWSAGTQIQLQLEMPVRVTYPHPRIDAVRGCAALERGPLVYCLEQSDMPASVDLEEVSLSRTEAPRPRPVASDPAGTDMVLDLEVIHRLAPKVLWPYSEEFPLADAGERIRVRAIPYFAWGNRSAGGMRVWIPIADEEANE